MQKSSIYIGELGKKRGKSTVTENPKDISIIFTYNKFFN